MSIPRNLSIIADTLNSDGTFASISNTGSTTLSSGTANGVSYLNGSKVLTTGSALTFDGTNLGIGTSSPAYKLDVNGQIRIQGGNFLRLTTTGTTNLGYLGNYSTIIGSGNATDVLLYNAASGGIYLSTAGGNLLLDSSGNVGIGTSSPGYRLQVTSGATAATSYFSSTATPAYSATSYNGGNARIAMFGGAASGATTGINFSQGASFEAYFGAVQESGGAAAFVFQGYSGSAYAERMRIDSSGNVGIGTSSPGAKLQVITPSSGHGVIFRYTGGTNNPGLFFSINESTTVSQIDASGSTSGILAFATSSAERARITSGGDLLVGKTSGYRGGKLVVSSTNVTQTSTTANVQITTSDTQAINVGGSLGLGGQVGGDETPFGYISGRKENGTSGNYAGYLAFATQNSSAAVAEAMRIDSSGTLLVGQTAVLNSDSNSFSISPPNGLIVYNHATGTASSSEYARFCYAATAIGSITQSGTTAVLYNVTSDQRLKENIQNADSASALIDSLQVRQFDWKSDNTHQRYGFIAQELVTVAPEAVHQPTDPEEMMAVDYSKLVPMLVKEIQSLRKRLTALESKEIS